jgi:DNA repair exonuclease SbcCD nuclease subunit
MKIAVTADAHLSTRDAHPERYRALEDVFKRTDEAGIEHLIIAGDLFNEDSQNYSEFESICRDHPTVEVHIIPGNHDPDISKKSITGKNVHIYTEPQILEIDSLTFLFVPYEKNAKMGEKIAQLEDAIDGKEWVLVGHGNFYGGVKERNPLEPGTYMPLSRKDLGRFKPRKVFLGHIHKPHSPHDHVHYVGSPCGQDISETGHRRFLVYDTTKGNKGNIEYIAVETDVLYFTETFLVLPREDEVPLLKQEIVKRIESWNIDASDHSKVQVRVEANGYAKDRSAVREALERGFADFAYYKDQPPTIDDLSISSDDQLEAISERTMNLIEKLNWPFGGDGPTRDEVELAALSVIYGN